jgi:hypothetical protein
VNHKKARPEQEDRAGNVEATTTQHDTAMVTDTADDVLTPEARFYVECLRRRRAAARRLPPLESGVSDPWRWSA